MSIENGDFIRINYTGRIKETDEVFETSIEEVAIEADIFDDNKVYRAFPMVLGGMHFIKKVQDELVGLNKGDSKTVEVSCEDTFGERNPANIKLLTMKDFRKYGLKPEVGMRYNMPSHGEGKVVTINGGRIKMDFNHPLAGHDLIFDVDIVDVIEEVEDQIKALIDLYNTNTQIDIDKTKIEINDNVVNIELDELYKFSQSKYMDVTMERINISRDVWTYIDGVEKVNFIDSFKKPEPEPEEEE